MLLQFVLKDSTFLFSLRAKFHAGDELTKILVARAGRNEEGKSEFARGFQIFDFRLRLGRGQCSARAEKQLLRCAQNDKSLKDCVFPRMFSLVFL